MDDFHNCDHPFIALHETKNLKRRTQKRRYYKLCSQRVELKC